ncbi:hypothetical protein PC123_g22212 [Phytophthora cactorum]|nr:hypothetical protein PC123_g22212 [Phytophthora cactorum]
MGVAAVVSFAHSAGKEQEIYHLSAVNGLTRGERKLLALVTALLANPSIFFIEEPTHELGTSSAEKIGANLLAFETGLTVTVTLHHPSTHFDGLVDMLHLHRGCIVCIRWKSFRRCRVLELGMSPEYMSRVNYFML